MIKPGSVLLLLGISVCSAAFAQLGTLPERAAKGDAAALTELIEQARRRNADAEFALGEMTYQGKGVPRNASQAFRLFERAAKRDHVQAQNALGYAYQHGLGTKKDAAEAARWYRSAAERGDARAQVNLGTLYRDGAGVPKDEAAALDWFRKAAAQGSTEALFNIAYTFEHSATPDFPQARAAYAKAADAGMVLGTYRLGTLLERGLGGPSDLQAASVQYRRAVEQGYARALADERRVLVQLGETNEKENLEKAAGYYRRAAALSDERAIRRIAILLDDGKVPEEQDGETELRLRAALKTDDPDLQFRLANRLAARGRDDKEAAAEAVRRYRSAAESGHARSALQLALALDEGRGTARNPAEAHRWYLAALKEKLPEALYRLAVQYDTGRGVGADSRTALDYYTRAADAGHPGAEAAMRRLLGPPPGTLPPFSSGIIQPR